MKNQRWFMAGAATSFIIVCVCCGGGPSTSSSYTPSQPVNSSSNARAGSEEDAKADEPGESSGSFLGESHDLKGEEKAEDKPVRTDRPRPDLIVESWRFSQSNGFVTATGEVTNITSRKLDNVAAVASFYTADNSIVKTSTAIVEYNPILPGQTSPFEVIDTGNPEIETARINFKHLLGGTISVMTREKFEEPTPEEIAARERAEEARRKADEEERIRLAKEARLLAEEEAARKKERMTRTWKDESGKFSVTAEFIRYKRGKALLRKENGKQIEVPIDRLSEKDKEFLRELWRERGETPRF